MTRSENSGGWIVVREDGSIYRPRSAQESPATLFEGMSGIVLGIKLPEGPFYLIAPGPEGKLNWIMTTDISFPSGRRVRRLGPGIESPHPVRLYLSDGNCCVLTDGGLETAMNAYMQMQEAMQLSEAADACQRK